MIDDKLQESAAIIKGLLNRIEDMKSPFARNYTPPSDDVEAIAENYLIKIGYVDYEGATTFEV